MGVACILRTDNMQPGLGWSESSADLAEGSLSSAALGNALWMG